MSWLKLEKQHACFSEANKNELQEILWHLNTGSVINHYGCVIQMVLAIKQAQSTNRTPGATVQHNQVLKLQAKESKGGKREGERGWCLQVFKRKERVRHVQVNKHQHVGEPFLLWASGQRLCSCNYSNDKTKFPRRTKRREDEDWTRLVKERKLCQIKKQNKDKK